METVAVVNPKTPPIPKTFYYIDLESVESGILVKENIVSSDDAPSRAQRVLQINDILYQTVRPYQKNNYFFEVEREIPTVASTGYAQIRTAENPYFFYELFHTPRFVSNVLLRCTGTSYPAVSGSDLNDIKVAYPNRIEQQKIAAFVQLLEKRIDAQRRLVEALKSYKRGVIQGLFSNRVLGNSTYNHWKEYAIKDLFSNIIDKNHPTEDVLTIIQGVGTVPRNSVERRISYDTAYLSTYKKVKQNDFILHLRSFEGGLEIANQDGLVSPAYTILRSKEYLVPSFFYAYFRSYEFISRKLRTTVEGIRDGKSINMDGFWNIKIPYPSLSEQELLSKGLKLTDKMLNATTQKLNCMQTLKRKLLADLFI